LLQKKTLERHPYKKRRYYDLHEEMKMKKDNPSKIRKTGEGVFRSEQ